MNDSTAAHWFKIKESNRRSTHCRTDSTPHAVRVSHPQGRIESHLLLGREVSRHHPPPGLLTPPRQSRTTRCRTVLIGLTTLSG